MTGFPNSVSPRTVGGIAVTAAWGDPEDQPDERYDTDEAPAGQEASP